MQCLDVRQDFTSRHAVCRNTAGSIRFTGCIGIVALGETEYPSPRTGAPRVVEHTPTMAEVLTGALSLRVEVLGDRGLKPHEAPPRSLQMDHFDSKPFHVPTCISLKSRAANLFWTRWRPPEQATNSVSLPGVGGWTLRFAYSRSRSRSPARRWYALGVSGNLRERGCTMLYDNVPVLRRGRPVPAALAQEAVRFAGTTPD